MLTTLHNRNFALIWTAGLISMTGDYILGIGLALYVLTLTGSVLLTSLMFIVSFAPVLLLGSFAGVLVDRWDRKRTMVISQALQVGAILPLLFVTSTDHLWLVYASGFAESTISLFFGPAEGALLPLLVEDSRLASANALSGVNRNLAALVGPALGGIIVAAWGLNGLIWGDAASFALAALLIAIVRTKGLQQAPLVAAESDASSGRARRGMLRELQEGLGIVARQREVAVLFLMGALKGVGEGLFSVLLIVWINRILHGGAQEFGWILSAQAIGGLLGGALIAGLIAPRVRPARLLGVCALIFGLIDLAIVNAPLLPAGVLPASPVPEFTSSLVLLVVALFTLVGIPINGVQTGRATLFQQAVPNSHLGRVMSLYQGMFALTTLGGMALAGAYGDQFNIILMLNVQGLVQFGAGVIAILFLWRVRPQHIARETTTKTAAIATVAAE